MACLVIIFGTLSAVYIIPTLYHEYHNLEDMDSLSRRKQPEEQEAFKGPEGPAKKDQIGDVFRKAQEQATKVNQEKVMVNNNGSFLYSGL